MSLHCSNLLCGLLDFLDFLTICRYSLSVPVNWLALGTSALGTISVGCQLHTQRKKKKGLLYDLEKVKKKDDNTLV